MAGRILRYAARSFAADPIAAPPGRAIPNGSPEVNGDHREPAIIGFPRAPTRGAQVAGRHGATP